MVTLHEGNETIGPHYAWTGEGDRPSIPARVRDFSFYTLLRGRLSSIDVQANAGPGKAAATDTNIKTIAAGVKLVQWESMIVRRAIATIKYLNEGMCVSAKEDTGYDCVGHYTVGIDQLEVPPFKISPTTVHEMMEMKLFWTPDAFQTTKHG